LRAPFNSNIVRAARRTADRLIAEGKDVKFYLIGKKGRAVINRLYPGRIVHQVDQSHIKNVAFTDALEVARDLTQRFGAGEFDIAELFFARFQSALVQEPTELQIIPVSIPTVETGTSNVAAAAVEYEPDEAAILAELLPRNVAVQLFRAMLENAASEQGSRMTAMDNATRNAGDMINKLTIQYNRTRQAAITTELIEIIAGAEAL
jgi:F-type H+-transporting ATPase subunit gamma